MDEATSLSRPIEGRFAGIQALRACAALMVVIHHALLLWRERLGPGYPVLRWTNGSAGVDLFFVISGFVMAISTPASAAGTEAATRFIWRRLIRVAPLYWIFTTLKLFAAIAGRRHSPLSMSLGSGWHVLASYLFLPARDPMGSVFPVLFVGWTLNFEMLFYLLFSAAIALRLRPLYFLVPVLSVISVVGLFSNDNWPAVLSLASPIVLEFLFGVLLAKAASRNLLPNVRWSLVLAVSGCFLLLTLPGPALTYSLYDPWRCLRWGLPAFAIVTASVSTERIIGSLIPSWLLNIGNASYAIYLSHTLMIGVTRLLLVRAGASGPLALIESIFVEVTLSLAVGYAVHRLVEVPMMRFFIPRKSVSLRSDPLPVMLLDQ